jgi:hypothetical protein
MLRSPGCTRQQTVTCDWPALMSACSAHFPLKYPRCSDQFSPHTCPVHCVPSRNLSLASAAPNTPTRLAVLTSSMISPGRQKYRVFPCVGTYTLNLCLHMNAHLARLWRVCAVSRNRFKWRVARRAHMGGWMDTLGELCQ